MHSTLDDQERNSQMAKGQSIGAAASHDDIAVLDTEVYKKDPNGNHNKASMLGATAANDPRRQKLIIMQRGSWDV
jgi:hypothetical protein